MKTEEKPILDELIFEFAYKRTTYLEKEVLLIIGGILSFARGLWRLDFHEAVYAPASHCFSVAHSAMNQSKKTSSFIVMRVVWIVLAVSSGIQAILFSTAACFLKPHDDGDVDTLAAIALGLLRHPTLALKRTQIGLQLFPNSILLKRRLVQCYIVLHEYIKLRELLKSLEFIMSNDGISVEEDSELFVRLACTLATGWKKLDNDTQVRKWVEQAIPVCIAHGLNDQLIKLSLINN